MELIDTHCHIYLPEYAADIDQVIQRAETEGIKYFFLPAIDGRHAAEVLALADRFPYRCRPMAGLHPCSVGADWSADMVRLEKELALRRFAAVGEIGLDFHWSRAFEAEQYEAFRRQIALALEHGLPIVIHSRDAMREAIGVVAGHQRGNLRGIFHCFGESLEMARQITDLGFLLGIGGVVTYKKSGLSDVLRDVDLSSIVLETDAPYLTPVPFRGKRNEPAYLRYVVEAIALAKALPVEEVARVTTENALKLFGA